MSESQDDATTTCLCWRVTRRDGFVLRLCNHDRTVRLNGERYVPGASVMASSFTSSDDLEPGRASVRGGFRHDAITEEDVRAGLWDGARIDVIRADWQLDTALQAVWSGRLSAIQMTRGAFEAELVSLKADLERPVGRQVLRRCDARLGDARCGVDVSDPDLPQTVCDHQWATCRDVFANSDNFRGFPHLPGVDFLLAGPHPGAGE